MLPQVVKSLEDKIQVLSYPEAEKNGMLYRLRDALAGEVPDIIAKVIVEVGSTADGQPIVEPFVSRFVVWRRWPNSRSCRAIQVSCDSVRGARGQLQSVVAG
jgi:hypothetical protein